ncbi:MAG: Holliday junction resolvase RuvX [Peptococcaceae bacterium]|nr:Holliday junction resolvase RuvX [Peptococcaceae bacterium]
MRVMGLDIGDKRIGIALSDELGIAASGLEIYQRTSLNQDVKHIADLASRYDVGSIVAGLPKTLNGAIGPQAEKVLKFIEKLKKYIDVPVITWDERLTTVEVEKLMIDAGVRRSRRKKVIDKLAATVILNSYLKSVQA